MRLLIVDDGHYIVEYLKHLLDWNSFGIGQIETSTNSVEAKDMLSRNHYDILITDIRMPEVSGIDLLEHIHACHLKTKVVFLSGYSQFDYAQKGIRLGILDYILKPVDKEDMEKAMEQVVKAVRAQAPPAKPVDWSNFDGLGFLLSVLSEGSGTDKEYKLYADLLEKEQFRFFRMTERKEIDEATIRDLAGEFECFVWSAESMLAGAVPESAYEAIAGRMNDIVFSEPFRFAHRNSVRHLFYPFFYNENVSVGDFAWLRDAEPFPKAVEKEQLRRQMLKKFAQLDARIKKLTYLIELLYFLYGTDGTLTSNEAARFMFSKLRDPDGALQAIAESLSQCEKNKKLSNDTIIRRVQAYIDTNLSDCLSLDELGEHVHLHPVYLSKLYKQATGENLSSYIAMKRLEKASRLLTESCLHVADIAQLVGYKKPQYFIKLFKDEFGITPQQYRKQRR
ncbi:response regulator [Paenibacillus nanensis]|uniref:Response regulator n=1 Tax=Paenibacillus nanensis TaxID=393251 RepID=A0A3A1VIS8_9BACL|nr:response regulator [Paenibacillus nanensis]RIX59526.1 response regulator [Paenibacillus nanensis]